MSQKYPSAHHTSVPLNSPTPHVTLVDAIVPAVAQPARSSAVLRGLLIWSLGRRAKKREFRATRRCWDGPDGTGSLASFHVSAARRKPSRLAADSQVEFPAVAAHALADAGVGPGVEVEHAPNETSVVRAQIDQSRALR